ncbi:hypothetical protein C0J45_6097, partial [Silurus meridionalis]
VEKVEEFRYLGSTVQSNGECVREVKKRVQAGWSGWRRVTGVICYRRVSARVKEKVYKTEMKMDRIRNKFIRGTAHVGRFGDKVREAQLRCFGHVQRRDMEYISRTMLRMELPERRKRGRPRSRFMDVVRND